MNLKRIRIERGMTQRDVADYLGCSPVVYSRYENGERMPSLDILIKLADYFQVTVDYLAGRSGVTFSALSPFEQELVRASRSADKRANEDALCLLNNHKI